MAGTYPDIPDTRFALDQDGSVLKWRNYTTSSGWTDVTPSLADVTRVGTTQYASCGTFDGDTNFVEIAVAFPEARSVNGLYIHPGFSAASGASNYAWEYSTDTTDGTDGTWSSFSVVFSQEDSHDRIGQSGKPYYRSDIAPANLTDVKGIRFRWRYDTGVGAVEYRIFTFHIYGSRPTSSVDRLAFWDPTLDQAVTPAHLDFGDHPQGTISTKQVRVKNLSDSLTANSVTVNVSDLTSEFSSNLEVSADDTTYSSSIGMGTLAAGTISGTVYVRRTVPGAETETQRNARLLANASSWS